MANPRKAQPLSAKVDHELYIEPTQQDIHMSKDKFRNVLDDFYLSKSKPIFEDSVPWFIAAITILLTIVSSDFVKWGPFSASTWSQIAVTFVILTAAVGGSKLWLFFKHIRDKISSTEETVEAIMEDQRKRWSDAAQERELDTSSPVTVTDSSGHTHTFSKLRK
ncbi:MAG: hypothetical protein HOF01_08740 [Chloroflexi bacterium]|nr:hypothetical protein [Chloroflexota bacterium]